MLDESIWRLTTSVVCHSHYENGRGGRICHFQWKTSDIGYDDRVLGSGFGAPFFIGRHQLLKMRIFNSSLYQNEDCVRDVT
uniref:Uncharacterized protein n=1 Tax=Peromyscus maniculatus bairdii TaxID=230844 RepID=A0A8C8W6Y1_PERMB